jgi:hypothetical protein
MSAFGSRLDGGNARTPHMQYLSVYDPRASMRGRRFQKCSYRPLTLKPVSVQNSSSHFSTVCMHSLIYDKVYLAISCTSIFVLEIDCKPKLMLKFNCLHVEPLVHFHFLFRLCATCQRSKHFIVPEHLSLFKIFKPLHVSA